MLWEIISLWLRAVEASEPISFCWRIGLIPYYDNRKYSGGCRRKFVGQKRRLKKYLLNGKSIIKMPIAGRCTDVGNFLALRLGFWLLRWEVSLLLKSIFSYKLINAGVQIDGKL